jgi:hypothetical protein
MNVTESEVAEQLRKMAVEHQREAEKLQRKAEKLLQAAAVIDDDDGNRPPDEDNKAGLYPIQPGNPVPAGSPRFREVFSLLLQYGPLKRSELMEKGIPEGTLATVLREGPYFRRIDGGRWEVVAQEP